ncbi:hypothetical protein CB1_000692035 [Camelus ferus]|nr:hypothetical protein CB1_000692035 [Camelus ferus]
MDRREPAGPQQSGEGRVDDAHERRYALCTVESPILAGAGHVPPPPPSLGWKLDFPRCECRSGASHRIARGPSCDSNFSFTKVGGNQGLETAQTVDWAADRTLVTSLDRARISLQERVGLAWRGGPLLVHPGSFAPTWLEVGWAEGLDSLGPWLHVSVAKTCQMVGKVVASLSTQSLGRGHLEADPSPGEGCPGFPGGAGSVLMAVVRSWEHRCWRREVVRRPPDTPPVFTGQRLCSAHLAALHDSPDPRLPGLLAGGRLARLPYVSGSGFLPR